MSIPPQTATVRRGGLATPAFPGRARLRPPPAATAGAILAVWATPRSRSTALLRSLQARGDLQAFFEPFSRSYYAGEERGSLRFAGLPPRAEYNHANVLDALARHACNGDVCIKDMALHVIGRADASFLRRFQHSFLIRHPAETLPSLHARLPDFSLEEAGFRALRALFERVRALGLPAVVIDAEDLVRRPEAILRAYCAAIGRPFRPEQLAWEALPERRVNLWDDTDDWHRALKASRGFQARAKTGYVRIDEVPRLKRMLALCLPDYERLRSHSLC